MKPEKRMRIQFTETDVCFLLDGLHYLKERAYPPDPEVREDGERAEVHHIEKMIRRLQKKVGLDE